MSCNNEEMKAYLNGVNNQGIKSHKERRKHKEYWDIDLQTYGIRFVRKKNSL